ncbi:MAG: efflux RND transporter periplasmic adaptor subunit [Opitutaceae bacterium]|nr:efflux RND transporter periplasmic adaptor subunit [Opitutaceae bacterium]
MKSRSLLYAAVGFACGAALILLLPAQALFHVPQDKGHTEIGGGERWACPMMDFIGNKAGKCPVCGMDLARVTAGELTREQQRRMGVELVEVHEGPAKVTVRAYGAVKYDDRTLQVVVPRIAGRVVKRHEAARHIGTVVKVGDPIIDLYSPEVLSAQGELAAAVKLRETAAIDALSERFERWNLTEVADAILAGNKPRDTVTIRSAFAGRVVASEADSAMAGPLPQVGQELMGQEAILRLVDPNSFMIVVHVPEPRVHVVRPGQPVRLASDDRGELSELEATVSWVSPELNLEIRSREVHLHVQDASRRLLPGSLVNARFEAALDAKLEPADPARPDTRGTFTLVPKTAVLSTGVRNVAWRVAKRGPDGRVRFELVPVALGPRIEDGAGNDLYVVKAGLKPGDAVAAQGAFLIDSQAQLAGTESLLFPRGATGTAPAHAH